MTAKEVTRILEAAQGEFEVLPGAAGGRRRGSLHLLDDRPADHGFSPTSTSAWGVWALRRRFARDGVADPRAPRAASRRGLRRAEAAPREAPAAAAAPEPAAKKKGRSEAERVISCDSHFSRIRRPGLAALRDNRGVCE